MHIGHRGLNLFLMLGPRILSNTLFFIPGPGVMSDLAINMWSKSAVSIRNMSVLTYYWNTSAFIDALVIIHFRLHSCDVVKHVVLNARARGYVRPSDQHVE